MGVALFKIKLMPESPSANLETIKNTAKEDIEELTGKVTDIEEQPIAFGLKAVILGIFSCLSANVDLV